MRLLLDTHAFLWWLTDDRKLAQPARDAMADTTSIVHVSAASFWEIAIKAQLGKVKLGRIDLTGTVAADGFVELPITARHAMRAGGLPRHHDDPFDRMLIAQAQIEGLLLVSRDRVFGKYGISVLAT